MNQSVAANAILIALQASALWLAWHFLWRRACQEVLRQRLFSLRDELFDFARGGGVHFEEPAYVLVRMSINSVIRFAHQISATRLFVFVALSRYIKNPESEKPAQLVTRAIAECPDKKAKEMLAAIHQRMYAEIARHLLFSSPHIVVVAPILFCFSRVISAPKAKGRPCMPREYRNRSAILVESQAGEAFKTERALRSSVQDPVAA